MYSTTLFMVLLSDHGVFGSGSTPMSAEESTSQSTSSLTRPVKVQHSPTPISVA